MFTITIHHVNDVYRYPVEHKDLRNGWEQFTVNGRNGRLVIQSNRPMLRARGLKHKAPIYKLVEGQLFYQSFYNLILEAIRKEVEKW